MPSSTEPLVILARLGAPHGVRGALHVNNAGEHLRRLVGNSIKAVNPTGETNGILTQYFIKGDFTLKRCDMRSVEFAEVTTREAAAALTNAYLAYSLESLRALVQSERRGKNPHMADLWYFEMIGLTVLDYESGEPIGSIASVEEMGRNTLVGVTLAAQVGITIEVPLDYPHWQDVDLAQRQVSLSAWRDF